MRTLKVFALLFLISPLCALDKPYYLYDYRGNLNKLNLINTVDDIYARLSIAVNIYGDQTIAGSKTFTDYTLLGSDAPAIKVKKLTGTTPASENGEVSVAHGLTGDKIISVNVMVRYATNYGMTPGYSEPGNEYEYSYYYTSTDVWIILSATNSGSILSKPFVVTILYEE